MSRSSSSRGFVQGVLICLLALGLAIPEARASEPPLKIIPYAGVIELNGVAISDQVNFNFALFSCDDPDASCPTPVWVATGTWDSAASSWREGWPVDGTPIPVTVYSGRFAVELGGASMAPLATNLFIDQHAYFLAMQVEGIALTGLKRLGHSAAAIRAYQAEDFLVRGDLDVQGAIQSGPITTSGDIRVNTANGQIGISNNFALRDTGDTWLRLRSSFGGEDYADLAVGNMWMGGNVEIRGNLEVRGRVERSDCTWTNMAYTHISSPQYVCPEGKFVVGIQTKYNGTYVDVYPGGMLCCKIGNQ